MEAFLDAGSRGGASQTGNVGVNRTMPEDASSCEVDGHFTLAWIDEGGSRQPSDLAAWSF